MFGYRPAEQRRIHCGIPPGHESTWPVVALARAAGCGKVVAANGLWLKNGST